MTETSYICLVIGLISILALWIPAVSGYEIKDLDKTILASSILSCKDIYLSFLVSSIPFLVDTLLDYKLLLNPSKRYTYLFFPCVLSITNFLSALQLVILSSTPSILYFTTNRTMIYILTIYSIRIIGTSSIFFYLVKSNRIWLSSKLLIICCFLGCFGVLIRFYAIGRNGTIFTAISSRLTNIIFLFLLLCSIYWIYRFYRAYRTLELQDYASFFYFLCMFALGGNVFSTYFDYINSGHMLLDITSSSSQHVNAYIGSYTIFTIILTIIPGRIARMESVTHLQSIIDAKKAFIRFISHEMRTPLNTVFLGLNLSIDQISEYSTNPIEIERRETLCETVTACRAALDILNELLIYDKLENGVLILNKSTIKIYDLIYDSINMFSVQIREKNITMKIINYMDITLTNNESDGNVRIESKDNISNILPTHDVGSSNISNNNTSNHHIVTNTYNNNKDGDSYNNSDEITNVSNNCTTFNTIPNIYNPQIYDNDIITVDKNKITQVIRNVLSNAIKFTSTNGHITITIKYVSEMQTENTDNSPKKNPVKKTFFYPYNTDSAPNKLVSNKPIDYTTTTQISNTTTTANTTTTSLMSYISTTSSYTSQYFYKNNHPTDNTSTDQNYTKYIHVNDTVLDLESNRPIETINSVIDSHNNNNNNDNMYIKTNEDTSYVYDTTTQRVSPIDTDTSTQLFQESTRNTDNSDGIKLYTPHYPTNSTGHLVIEITDTGAGISKENQQKLFNEIVQFKPEILQNGGGSGLGMWISKGIVDLHQGTMSVYSAGEGQGSTFTIQLPMSRELLLPSTTTLNKSTISTTANNANNANTSTTLIDPHYASSLYTILNMDKCNKLFLSTLSPRNIVSNSSNNNSINNNTSSSSLAILGSNHDISISPHTTTNNNKNHNNNNNRDICTSNCIDSYGNNNVNDYDNYVIGDTDTNIHTSTTCTCNHTQITTTDYKCNNNEDEKKDDEFFIKRSNICISFSTTSPISIIESYQSDIMNTTTNTTFTTTSNTTPTTSMNTDIHQTIISDISTDKQTPPPPPPPPPTTTTPTTIISTNNSIKKTDSSDSYYHHLHNDGSSSSSNNNTNSNKIPIYSAISSNSDKGKNTIRKELVPRLPIRTQSLSESLETLSPISIHTKKSILNSSSSSSSVLPSKRLLVVDDSTMNRKMLCRLLQSIGYICIEACDGIQAVKCIQLSMMTPLTSTTNPENTVIPTREANINTDKKSINLAPAPSPAPVSTTITADKEVRIPPEDTNQHYSSLLPPVSLSTQTHPYSYITYDAILMDFMMPNMNGPTATTIIRQLGYIGPIIGVTGNGMKNDIDYFLQCGANKVLIKPVMKEVVIDALQSQNI